MDRTYQIKQRNLEGDGWDEAYPFVKSDSMSGLFANIEGVSGGVYTAILSPAPNEYRKGMFFFGRITNTNESSTVVMKLDGLANPNEATQNGSWVPVKDRYGSRQFSHNYFQANSVHLFVYDGIDFIAM